MIVAVASLGRTLIAVLNDSVSRADAAVTAWATPSG
jgi:hypothetical protein